jgi:hypothetical protein
MAWTGLIWLRIEIGGVPEDFCGKARPARKPDDLTAIYEPIT